MARALKWTALYRYWDARGQLLYVGVSKTPVARLEQHTTQSWVGDIASITLKWFSIKQEALSAECRAIRTEHPLHNKVWSRKRVRRYMTIDRAFPLLRDWFLSPDELLRELAASPRAPRYVAEGITKVNSGRRWVRPGPLRTALDQLCEPPALQKQGLHAA